MVTGNVTRRLDGLVVCGHALQPAVWERLRRVIV